MLCAFANLPHSHPVPPANNGRYVVPTPDMVIKPRHAHVDPSGLVQSPYMRNWAYPGSNLRDMAQVCCCVSDRPKRQLAVCYGLGTDPTA